MLTDKKKQANDYAKCIGWPTKDGMQVASPSDIAKALLAFHDESMESAVAETKLWSDEKCISMGLKMEVKTCPFCNGLPRFDEKLGSYGYTPDECRIVCSICGVATPYFIDGQWATDSRPRKERALIVWNNRKTE